MGAASEPPCPTAAFVLAMATLSDLGPARLLALTEDRSPLDAWSEVVEGRAHEGPAQSLMGADRHHLAARWAREASRIDPSDVWQRHIGAGLRAAARGDDEYPEALREDPHGPAIVVWQGQLAALDGPRVAVVGTRDCTHTGREFASQLGRELSEVGVRIVSGLALGIDGAAHAGALAAEGAPPIGVVGSGLDVVYPRRHARLWRDVATAGVLLSEHALGTEPVGWHFLARNRIIAMLADVVVVVESHEHGGSLQTATEAANRGRVVLAVPGSVRSPASRGTNALLGDAGVCCDTTDVLTVLGLVSAASPRPESRTAPSPSDAEVLRAVGWEPCSTEELMLRTGRSLGQIAAALDRLEDAGWIVQRGGWTERVASSSKTSRSR